MAEYKYVIRVDDSVAFEGEHIPNNLIPKLKKQNPKAEISIEWVDLSGELFIAVSL